MPEVARPMSSMLRMRRTEERLGRMPGRRHGPRSWLSLMRSEERRGPEERSKRREKKLNRRDAELRERLDARLREKGRKKRRESEIVIVIASAKEIERGTERGTGIEIGTADEIGIVIVIEKENEIETIDIRDTMNHSLVETRPEMSRNHPPSQSYRKRRSIA